MAKYREKETGKIVDAVQNSYYKIMDVIDFVTNTNDVLFTSDKDVPQMEIPTINGTIKINQGDWVLKFGDHQFLPCSPEIFKKAYEKVENE